MVRAFILILLGLECTALAAIDEGRKRELEEYVGKIPDSDCRYLSPEEKEFVRGFLSDLKAGPNEPSGYNRQLLQVGDEATIRAYIQVLSQGVGLDYAVLDSGEPRFIEPLAALLLREEPFVLSGGDAPTPPKSFSAATFIQHLIMDSPQFDSNVRNWARSLDGNDLVRLRSVLRTWWRANESALKRQDFGAVKRGDVSPPAESVSAQIEGPHSPAISPHNSGTRSLPSAAITIGSGFGGLGAAIIAVILFGLSVGIMCYRNGMGRR